MTRPNVQSWDPSASNNTDVGGIGLAENIMRPPAVNNALRELMAEIAKFYDDLGGVNTVAGSGDAITVTTASGFTALATGLVLSFRAGASNTTNVTINVDGLGAKAIRKVTSTETALVAGDLVAGGKYLLVYDAAANGAAGAWMLLNAPNAAFFDATFRVQDNGDATKQLALEVSGLTTGTTRTLTATDKNGTLILVADAVPGLGMVNGTLVTSVAGNALTIAIKTFAGNDPSAGDPVFVAFRNANAATGDYTVLPITLATSLVISSGSLMGASNATAFRLWVVGFNDAGTFRLGAVNALSGTSIMPLRDDILGSSTAEGGAGAADSAQVIYTGTAVSSKPMRILGYLDWATGLTTAGTWTSAPTKAQLFGPGVAKPGDVVQVVRTDTGLLASGTTTIPMDDTIPQNTEGTQFMAQAITPTSACSLLRVNSMGYFSFGGTLETSALFRDNGANALCASTLWLGAGNIEPLPLNYGVLAASTTTTTFKVRAGSANAGTTFFNADSSSRRFGGAMNSFLEIAEIMA